MLQITNLSLIKALLFFNCFKFRCRSAAPVKVPQVPQLQVSSSNILTTTCLPHHFVSFPPRCHPCFLQSPQQSNQPYRTRPAEALTPVAPQKTSRIPEFGMDYNQIRKQMQPSYSQQVPLTSPFHAHAARNVPVQCKRRVYLVVYSRSHLIAFR